MKTLCEKLMMLKNLERSIKEQRVQVEEQLIAMAGLPTEKLSSTLYCDKYKISISRKFKYSVKGDVPEGVDVMKTVVDETKLKKHVGEPFVEVKENKTSVEVVKVQ